MTEAMNDATEPTPSDPARRPGLDDDTDGLDCFVAEGASEMDEADDSAALVRIHSVAVVRIAPQPFWQLSWPGVRVTAVAAVLVVVGVIGMWMNLRGDRTTRTVTVPSSVPSSPASHSAVVPHETAESVTAAPPADSAPGPLPPAAAPRSAMISPQPAMTVDAAPPALVETTPVIPVESPIVVATPEVVTAPLASEAAVARVAIVTPPTDRASIENVLQQYRDAYDRLDAPSAAVIWPRVDTRALARAFGTLAEQDLSFDSCNLDIAGMKAEARCVGEIRYVRRVGDQAPRVRRMSWSFALERVSDRWQIAQVTAD
jgi:hypothetical protein